MSEQLGADRDVEARRVCSSCGEPTGYVVEDDEDGSVGGTAVSECCRAGLRVEVSSA